MHLNRVPHFNAWAAYPGRGWGHICVRLLCQAENVLCLVNLSLPMREDFRVLRCLPRDVCAFRTCAGERKTLRSLAKQSKIQKSALIGNEKVSKVACSPSSTSPRPLNVAGTFIRELPWQSDSKRPERCSSTMSDCKSGKL